MQPKPALMHLVNRQQIVPCLQILPSYNMLIKVIIFIDLPDLVPLSRQLMNVKSNYSQGKNQTDDVHFI